ncbi:MAG: hypothetical protein JEY96_19930 [Bacteroidales bacterium]|nr:hypothetical protein [Bacteroidales bacterium]
MRKTTCILFLIVLFGSSCEEESKPNYSYENVVDSTFYCEVTIDDENHIFDNHSKGGAGYCSVRDSIYFYYNFNFGNRLENSCGPITITFCKFFAIKDLENSYEYEDRWYFDDCLEQHEFLSIFQEENLQYSRYNLDEQLLASDGISIIFNGYGGTMWLTTNTALYLDDESIDSFYENANFNVTNLEILDENNIIIECTFNLEIFSEQLIGEKKNFSNGYFKGYLAKPYTNCR